MKLVNCGHFFKAIFPFLALAPMCLGCSSSSDTPKPEKEPVELQMHKGLSTDAPESDVFRAAKHLYEAGMYSVAKDSFDTIRDGFPLGAYATFAAIKSADCLFFNRDFIGAGKAYEDFLKSYPAGPEAPYVRLQAARSYIISNRGVGRDRVPLERALVLLDQVIKDSPGTGFAEIAQKEKDEVVRRLSEYDMFVIKFYEKQDNQAAVEARKKLYAAKWDPLVTEKSLSQQITAATMTPLEISQAEINEVAQAPTAAEIAPKDLKLIVEDNNGPSIRRVVCRSGDEPFALFEVNQFSPQQLMDLGDKVLQPEKGKALLNLNAAYGGESPIECFGGLNLTISKTGAVEIKSDSPLTVATLSNPDRILIAR